MLDAFDNALTLTLTLDVAMGGSTNTILHTLAIAREAGIQYDIPRQPQPTSNASQSCVWWQGD